MIEEASGDTGGSMVISACLPSLELGVLVHPFFVLREDARLDLENLLRSCDL